MRAPPTAAGISITWPVGELKSFEALRDKHGQGGVRHLQADGGLHPGRPSGTSTC